ncbi:hypothetical protein AC578_870 [Pseudocercospora eumusae]|uniref:Uncharacterized protein n=1 Tax=Pseudocercospora eumusae TaxID=321146 RepID=A0A139H409_9PEZI|nr:hypothetical protein AC578_870 [Pseudocercospora eumusae]
MCLRRYLVLDLRGAANKMKQNCSSPTSDEQPSLMNAGQCTWRKRRPCVRDAHVYARVLHSCGCGVLDDFMSPEHKLGVVIDWGSGSA